MGLRLYNTLTRRKEDFEPIDPGNVRMYVCGPTVYDYAHIGNARPVVVFDVLYRLLRQHYPKVTYVRNITDVDDKIINAAKETGETIEQVTTRTTKAFHEDMAALGALDPDIEPRATEHIPEMIAMIEQLIEAGHAYAADGHVLFDVPSWPDYGGLSRNKREDIVAGARVEVAPYKKDPADFVLWKPSTDEQPGWESPWGRGRPGWHLECSAMSGKHLGLDFDIHGGGQDLIFPHHENEIAQSRCAEPEHIFAKYWVHNGYLMAEGEKMSKSLGNFYTVHELLEEFPGEAIRLLLLKTHYRQPLDFTKERLREAKAELDYLYRAVEALKDVMAIPCDDPLPIEQPRSTVTDDLDDDLNTPLAISRIHLLAKYVFEPWDLKSEISGEQVSVDLGQVKYRLEHAAGLLGLLQQDPEVWFKGAGAEGVAEIEDLIARREGARKAKDFAEADRIRDELEEMGVVLEDGPDGTTWRRAG
ncbi:MAG: cysteine--tRNA ligase [Alphaproteobacteria bacterium]|nr:cysteine--tRNA ligase [Alphaproteobacteria bacterium]